MPDDTSPPTKHPVSPPDTPRAERRDFLKQAACVAIGGAVGLVPFGAGVAVYLDPLRRKSAGGTTVKVTNLEALPINGEPRKFSIFADKQDAWTTFPKSPVGAVYILRTGEKELKVLNVVCPHAGCFVDFVPERDGYFCPCHDSTFHKDGKIADAHSPSPRPLDDLKYELRDGGEVWVEFQNFLAGEHDKIPV